MEFFGKIRYNMLYCEKAYMITREELTKTMEENKYRYNDISERLRRMNRIYMGSHDLYGGTDFVVSVDETDES